ncbi:putative short chain dehydrogenase [Myxococcus hansupus]|uniref:Putative short chain dehydrogenase n=1 Tax=Pseudomyxococcus hansupus TaxID=1297742 RepID=A0A0H4X4K3_9BACT|nr:putative short chain dehydrogenase [Myxococcus hansupus]
MTAHLHDVSEEKSVARLVKKVTKGHGTDAIHLLFNNAGVVGGGSFVVGPRDEWEQTFAVSWFGTFANYQPLSAKEAAEAILGAVSTGDWRGVIGQDAEAIDARGRPEPWSVYD